MWTTFKILWFIFPAVFTSGGIRAQENSSAFSLTEALAYAAENSYILKNTTLEISKSRKKVWETITGGLPQVSGTGNYNRFLNLRVSLIPGEFFGEAPGTYIPVRFGQDYSSDFGFTVSQMIFDGSYIVGVGSSQIYLDLARQSHEKTLTDIRIAVAQAYYYALVGIENLKVMGDNLGNSRKMLVETTAYYENGFMEEQDVDQIRMLVKTSENEVLKAEREIAIAMAVLKYTMGMPLEREIELSDSLYIFLEPLLNAQPATGLDFTAHIDYRLASTQYLAAGKLLMLEKSQFLPRLNGFYSYSKTAYGNKANLFRSTQSWYPSSLIGLSVTVPLFTSGQRMLKIQQAGIGVQQAENQREQISQTIQKDYMVALANLETAIEKYGNDMENKHLASKILEKGKIKFNNGLTSSTELMQLENQFLQSHGAFIGSVLNLLLSDLELRKAKGQL